MKCWFIAVAMFAVGCGASASTLENCKKLCESQRRCGASTDTQAAACNSTCDANKNQYNADDAAAAAQCKNTADVLNQLSSCLGMDCNKIDPCVAAVDTTCVPK